MRAEQGTCPKRGAQGPRAEGERNSDGAAGAAGYGDAKACGPDTISSALAAQERAGLGRADVLGEASVRAHQEGGGTRAQGVAVRRLDADDALEGGSAVVEAVAYRDEHVGGVAHPRSVDRLVDVRHGVRVVVAPGAREPGGVRRESALIHQPLVAHLARNA